MVVPFSELSSTQTEPPWRSAISHTSESPSPAPPYSRLREEGLENTALIHLRDAAAGVGDAEQELFRLLSDRNPHRAARPVVLDGVLRQVEDQPVDQRVAAGHNAVALRRQCDAALI